MPVHPGSEAVELLTVVVELLALAVEPELDPAEALTHLAAERPQVSIRAGSQWRICCSSSATRASRAA